MNGSKRATGSDFQKIDAHEATAADLEEIPELDDAWFNRAELNIAGKPAKRGRPRSANAKQLLTLRLDPDVIEAFRATGPGWQARMSEVLKSAAQKMKSAA